MFGHACVAFNHARSEGAARASSGPASKPSLWLIRPSNMAIRHSAEMVALRIPRNPASGPTSAHRISVSGQRCLPRRLHHRPVGATHWAAGRSNGYPRPMTRTSPPAVMALARKKSSTPQRVATRRTVEVARATRPDWPSSNEYSRTALPRWHCGRSPQNTRTDKRNDPKFFITGYIPRRPERLAFCASARFHRIRARKYCAGRYLHPLPGFISVNDAG